MWKYVLPAILFLLANKDSWTLPVELTASVKNTQNLSRNKLLSLLCAADCPPIGGQAVIEGVMLRNGNAYGLAVRKPDGVICARRMPWQTYLNHPWLRLPFIRGFPILLETIANGIQALNRSTELVDGSQTASKDSPGILISVVMAFFLALLLFIAAPHLLSLLMHELGLGGDVDGFSFHIWDGFFKCAIFMLYIWLISFVPDIRRVFEYHGAEHKIIHAWESGKNVDSHYAFAMSRLHPRCGTTFLLFVITLSIILQAIFVPFAVHIWHPLGGMAKHAYTLAIKILLVMPISAAAYELIRFAAHLRPGPLALFLQSPGLALQRLTTREPSEEQLEVAVVALAVALNPEDAQMTSPAPFCRLDSGFDI